MKYRVFKRSCKNWKQFASARKITVERNCTLERAQQMCDEYNNNRSWAQINRGTKMEFEREET